MQDQYNVVFMYKPHVPGYAGAMTWSQFESKKDFQSWYNKDIQATQDVVTQGVTAEHATEITRLTPLEVRIAIAKYEATDKKDGSIDLQLLKMELRGIELQQQLSGAERN